MEIRTSDECAGCMNLELIEELQAREAAAENAGSLVLPGRVICAGLRRYRIHDRVPADQERCRIDYTPPVVSDPALAQEIAAIRLDPHIRPAAS